MAVRKLDYPRDIAESSGPLDEVFGQRARMAIMSSLLASGELPFVELKQVLGLTDGNLSSHLAYLEKRGLIVLDKGFEGKKPFTRVSPTQLGRQAFEAFVASLERLVASLRGASKDDQV